MLFPTSLLRNHDVELFFTIEDLNVLIGDSTNLDSSLLKLIICDL